jgi:hypothetical protein
MGLLCCVINLGIFRRIIRHWCKIRMVIIEEILRGQIISEGWSRAIMVRWV